MDDLVAGRYRRIRPLGSGGGGSVWLAEDTVLGRDVAVKTILPIPGEDGGELARGMREARAAAALRHPGAVAVYDVLEDDHAIVMEYVDGRSLDTVLEEDGPLSPRRAAAVLLPVAGALADAHAAHVIHRDIKPGNVMVTADDQGRLADFGIARALTDVSLTRTGFTAGTAGYFSPELADGAGPSPESDVWALGVTLYQLVEGRLPVPPQPNVLAHLRTIASEPPIPPRQAGDLTELLEVMLARDPARRPPMDHVVTWLEDVALGRPVRLAERTEVLPTGAATVPPTVPSPQVTATGHGASAVPGTRPRGVLVAAGAAAALLLGGGVTVAALLSGGGDTPAPGPSAPATVVVTEPATTTTAVVTSTAPVPSAPVTTAASTPAPQPTGPPLPGLPLPTVTTPPEVPVIPVQPPVNPKGKGKPKTKGNG